MCDPLTLGAISGGSNLIQGVAGLFGQQAQADAANKAGRANLTAAVDAAGGQQAQLNRQQIEADQQDTEERVRQRLAFKAAQATTIASLDGAEGNTADLLLGDLQTVYGSNLGAINRNAKNRRAQYLAERKGIDAQATARGTYQKTPGVSFLDAGMVLLGAGAQGASDYLKYKPKE